MKKDKRAALLDNRERVSNKILQTTLKLNDLTSNMSKAAQMDDYLRIIQEAGYTASRLLNLRKIADRLDRRLMKDEYSIETMEKESRS